MLLSVVTTLYNSAPHLLEFHARAHAAARRITDDYEIVMVDDGSPDASSEMARDLVSWDPRLRLVELSRNFGHHPALMTGLEHARGDLVFLLDSDLEEDPALLERFHDVLLTSGADAVHGQQDRRKGGFFERTSGAIFYRVFNALSSYPIPENALTVRLMKRRFVDALLRHGEREFCLSGLAAITGFQQVGVTVPKGHKGRSDYDVSRKAALALHSIVSFSDRPLKMIAGLGLLLFGTSGLALLAILVLKLVFHADAPGYASLMASIWFLGGMTILSIGVIGLYVGRVFVEVKGRPRTLVRAVHTTAPCCGETPADPIPEPRPAPDDEIREALAIAGAISSSPDAPRD